MTEKPYVPGPYDTFRGTIDIDCFECLTPEQKAQFRIGKFVPVEEMDRHIKPFPEPPATDTDKTPES